MLTSFTVRLEMTSNYLYYCFYFSLKLSFLVSFPMTFTMFGNPDVWVSLHYKENGICLASNDDDVYCHGGGCTAMQDTE
jgi:hypothetical protein